MVNMKFLGLQIDNHIYWKDHIEQMIPKLGAACYPIRSAVHINNINTLKLIYNAHFHSIIKYEIIVWGTLPTVEDLHFKKENHQNYGWYTTQKFKQKSV
jgi:hypothetical protein